MEQVTGLSITQHIYDILSQDEVLSGISSPIIAEEKTEFPFVLYKRSELRPIYSKMMKAGDAVGFEFAVVSNKYFETVEIAERIRKIFELRRDGYMGETQLMSATENYGSDAYEQRLVFSTKIINKN